MSFQRFHSFVLFVETDAWLFPAISEIKEEGFFFEWKYHEWMNGINIIKKSFSITKK